MGLSNRFSEFDRLYVRKRRRVPDHRGRKQNKQARKFWNIVFVTAAVSAIGYFSVLGYEAWQMSYNSKITEAVLKRVRYESYNINEMDSRNVEHYFLTFEFKVNSKTYRQMEEVESEDFDAYFNARPQEGDTVRIRYVISDPEKSELLELVD